MSQHELQKEEHWEPWDWMRSPGEDMRMGNGLGPFITKPWEEGGSQVPRIRTTNQGRRVRRGRLCSWKRTRRGWWQKAKEELQEVLTQWPTEPKAGEKFHKLRPKKQVMDLIIWRSFVTFSRAISGERWGHNLYCSRLGKEGRWMKKQWAQCSEGEQKNRKVARKAWCGIKRDFFCCCF